MNKIIFTLNRKQIAEYMGVSTDWVGTLKKHPTKAGKTFISLLKVMYKERIKEMQYFIDNG